MRQFSLPDAQHYFAQDGTAVTPHATGPVLVKTEASSPDLLSSSSSSSLHQFQFKFTPGGQHAPHASHQATASHGSLPSSRQPSEPPPILPQPIYRFGAASSRYNSLMSQASWPPSPTIPATTASPSSHSHQHQHQHPSHHASQHQHQHQPHHQDQSHPFHAGTSTPPTSAMINGTGGRYDLASLPNAGHHSDGSVTPYPGEYDDVATDLVELSGHTGLVASASNGLAAVNGANGVKNVRRRSSKACDQCRKSKCKCERSGPGEPCKSCIMLGTSCTFLGPSRKRGPPKGYIDAIEARLHQTEALLGIMISATDVRAQTLLRDIAKDPLAREIINRVDNSPYGLKGRKLNEAAGVPPGAKSASRFVRHASESDESDQKEPKLDLTSTHPSNEWQDRVSAILRSAALNGGGSSEKISADNKDASSDSLARPAPRLRTQQSAPTLSTSATASATAGDSASGAASSSTSTSSRPALRVDLTNPLHPLSRAVPGTEDSPARRQRRKIEVEGGADDVGASRMVQSPLSAPLLAEAAHHGHHGRHLHRGHGYLHHYHHLAHEEGALDAAGGGASRSRGWSVSSDTDSQSSESDEELTGAVGQLSLNEDEQVRYHGKVSGLHLLGVKERVDARNEGGIWRFPKARVWPPLPSVQQRALQDASGSVSGVEGTEGGLDEEADSLPDLAVQERLLGLYFAHVHPSFPIVHKRSFMEAFKAGHTADSPVSPVQDTNMDATATGTQSQSQQQQQQEQDQRQSLSPFHTRRRRRVPALLLLAMFAIAARYTDDTPWPADHRTMWAAGDEYLNRAKVLLDRTYASSRPTTCQALLLMGYREIGIGSMAQAWTYIGMAIRMAQDLGMHRSADGWARVDLGGRLFSDWELHERKRIWYSCVIIDKYVSTYIGRPLMIFERDFDTLLPGEDDAEEMEEYSFLQSSDKGDKTPPVAGRIISCFNASARLADILGMIVQAIYAVRPVSHRHAEAVYIETLLDKWYIDLPEHLRYDPVAPSASSSSPPKRHIPPPHILTLHMQYWCAVLLLHRPFIRHGLINPRNKSAEESDMESRAIAEKSYELCAGAANHITSIAFTYSETYSLSRSSVFLCYYIFTASILHVTTLSAYPADPQAQLGLSKCMDVLKVMEVVWPSAGRALELLQGSKVNLNGLDLAALSSNAGADRHKRSAEQPLDDGLLPSPAENVTQDYLQLRAPSYTPHYTPDASTAMFTPSLEVPPAHHPTGHTSPQASLPSIPAPGPPSADSSLSYASPTYDRWPTESLNSYPFSGTLSTSVLPQLYSTGLVDDHRVSTGGAGPGHHRFSIGGPHDHHHHHQELAQHPSHHHPQTDPQSDLHAPAHGRTHSSDATVNADTDRYPQYWNDYSTFPQLGPAYGNFNEQASVPHHHQPSAPSQIYLPEPYNLYNHTGR